MGKPKKTAQERLGFEAADSDADTRYVMVEEATQALGKLKRGYRVVGLTKGQFSFIDIIRALLSDTGPADMVLSTWTFGPLEIEELKRMMDGGLIKSLRILTDWSFHSQKPERCARLVELFGEGCMRVTKLHAKFALIRNEQWNVCCRGSMNMNKNPRWENFDIDEDAALCDFFEGMVAELELLTPPGPGPIRKRKRGGDFDEFQENDPFSRKVGEVFANALADRSCGDVRRSEMGLRERMASLGYTELEIVAREKPRSDFERGRDDLEDRYRDAVIASALNGDQRAMAVLSEWLEAAKSSRTRV